MSLIINIIRLKLEWLKGIFKGFSRFLYWGIRLAQAQIGKGVNYEFPIIVEGSGKLVLKDGVSLKKRSSLGLSVGSSITIGRGSKIHQYSNIHAGENTNIMLGEKCSILSHAVLRNGNKVSMDDGSSISSYCHIFPREPGFDGEFIMGKGSNIGDLTTIDTSCDVIIGEQVALGPYDIIYTHDHDYKADSFAAWERWCNYWQSDYRRRCLGRSKGDNSA